MRSLAQCSAEAIAALSVASPYKEGDFLLPAKNLRSSFVDDPLSMYEVAERIEVRKGHSLGDVYDPYFSRTASTSAASLPAAEAETNRLSPTTWEGHIKAIKRECPIRVKLRRPSAFR